MVETRPVRFHDRAGREIDLHEFGEGPVADERGALRGMYRDFDPEYRTLGGPPATGERLAEWIDVLVADHYVVAWHGERPVGQGGWWRTPGALPTGSPSSATRTTTARASAPG